MKQNKLPSLVSILGLTLITAILWVTFDIYRAFTKSPDEPLPQEIVNPLNPKLDMETLDKIQSGIYFDSSQVPDNVVTGATEEPLSVEPSASPSAEFALEEETATGSSEVLP